MTACNTGTTSDTSSEPEISCDESSIAERITTIQHYQLLSAAGELQSPELSISPNGTFCYDFARSLNSSIPVFGTWTLDGNVLILQESASAGETPKLHRFRVDGDDLLVLTEGSDPFNRGELSDGDRFLSRERLNAYTNELAARIGGRSYARETQKASPCITLFTDRTFELTDGDTIVATGEWLLLAASLTLTVQAEEVDGETPWIHFFFRVDGEELIFLAKGSSAFEAPYLPEGATPLADGDRFLACSDSAGNAAEK